MAQKLLDSLPNLENLPINKIMAKDSVKGSKWVCSQLKLLRTNISFDEYENDTDVEDKSKQDNMTIYKQLGELKRLEVLDLKTTTTTEVLRPTLARLEDGMWAGYDARTDNASPVLFWRGLSEDWAPRSGVDD
ncbi:hypothetical protein BGX27_010403 [Mortierella sp. AM989]|nr:hypothetical protein BGX27_010403 [Mortierella sp. AM989]